MPPPSSLSPSPSLLRSALSLSACVLSIYTCFLGYGLLHERIYKRRYDEGDTFSYSLFLVFCQTCGNLLFACLCLLFTRGPEEGRNGQIQKHSGSKNKSESDGANGGGGRGVPQRDFALNALSYIGAMYSSNLALNFMSYPAQSLAKSSKLIPVMIMRIVILKARYTMKEYGQIACVTGGIALFMAAEDTRGKESETSLIGLGLCVLSLALDGYTGPAQERMKAVYNPSMAQLQLYLNLWSLIFVTAWLIVTGEMWTGFAFCARHLVIVPDIAVFSILSALGQAAILFTVLRFGSLVLTTVTTTRKLFTILFSVFLYGHAINWWQWGGVVLVFLGLSSEIADKVNKKKSTQGKKED